MTTDYQDVLEVLDRAWSSPFRTRSEFARSYAEGVARAACLGLITTHDGTDWSPVWRITSRGLAYLEKKK